MSSILFDASYGTARVSGAEQASFSGVCQDIFGGMLRLRNRDQNWLKAFRKGLPNGHYLKDPMPMSFSESNQSLETVLRIASLQPITIYGIDKVEATGSKDKCSYRVEFKDGTWFSM